MRDSSHGLLLACKAAGTNASLDKKNHTLYHWLKEEDRERGKNETRRLLYVAATRAENTLTLFATLPAGKSPQANSLLATMSETFGALWESREPPPEESAATSEQAAALPVIHHLPANLMPPAFAGPAVSVPKRARPVRSRRAGPELDSPELLFALERRAAIVRGNLVQRHCVR